MYRVTYRVRHMIDRFTCIDHEETFVARDFYKPSDTSIFYFKTDRFNTKAVAEEDILKMEEF